MTHVNKYLSLYFFLIFSYIAPVNASENSCVGRGTVFFYGNGIFNTKKDARNSKERLKEEIGKKIIFNKDKIIRYEMAYQDSSSTLTSLLDVWEQKKLDDYENFWMILAQ